MEDRTAEVNLGDVDGAPVGGAGRPCLGKLVWWRAPVQRYMILNMEILLCKDCSLGRLLVYADYQNSIFVWSSCN